MSASNNPFGTDPFATDPFAVKDDTPAPVAAPQPGSVLGPTLVFKGELVAGEDLLVQGRVEGRIRQDEKNLTIGAQGKVKADIRGRNITVEGRVEGDMHGSEAVVIQESGNVRGNIFAPRVAIKEGAKFKGGIDMDPQPAAAAKSPPARATTTAPPAGEVQDTDAVPVARNGGAKRSRPAGK